MTLCLMSLDTARYSNQNQFYAFLSFLNTQIQIYIFVTAMQQNRNQRQLLMCFNTTSFKKEELSFYIGIKTMLFCNCCFPYYMSQYFQKLRKQNIMFQVLGFSHQNVSKGDKTRQVYSKIFSLFCPFCNFFGMSVHSCFT